VRVLQERERHLHLVIVDVSLTVRGQGALPALRQPVGDVKDVGKAIGESLIDRPALAPAHQRSVPSPQAGAARVS